MANDELVASLIENLSKSQKGTLLSILVASSLSGVGSYSVTVAVLQNELSHLKSGMDGHIASDGVRNLKQSEDIQDLEINMAKCVEARDRIEKVITAHDAAIDALEIQVSRNH